MTTAPKGDIPARRFPRAGEDAAAARAGLSTPQTESDAYRLAFQDTEFLLREDLRPVRFQLELLKPELVMAEAGVASTFVVYGSARIPSPEEAATMVNAPEGAVPNPVAQSLATKARYYAEARELGRLASSGDHDDSEGRHFVVCTGGGPSIMEAANRGAQDSGRESIGLNIVLPHEQAPNAFVTPDLSFQFHYFALRKMHFLLRARAVAVFPGGFGTMDETFELLTLIQTGKMKPIPIFLFGREFWDRVIDFDALVAEGVVSARDMGLFRFVDSAAEAWEQTLAFYQHRLETDPLSL